VRYVGNVNMSQENTVRVQRVATPLERKVSPTRTQPEEQIMNKILNSLLIAAVLSSTGAFAEDTLRTSMQDGKHRVDFSLNGNNKCVMIDDKITCAPMKQAPIRVASSESK
jgi:hypothetical protein